jgi:hypothetical protein
MIWILTRGLFLTCTKGPFVFSAHNIKVSAVHNAQKKKSLTWKGSPLVMVVNSHPLKSVA